MKISNKAFYIRKKEGGLNPCILGNPLHRSKTYNVLPNCVGWAVGRFNEMGGLSTCKYLGNTNAENFTNYCHTQGLTMGMIPKKGACMVWEGKGSLAGHVAIVEEVNNFSEVITSESGWSASKSYWTQTRRKGNGNWGLNSNYKFKGFIYNPNINEWPLGTYTILVPKTIRTSMSLIYTNRVKVKECMDSVKTKLTTKSPNDIAKLKKGTTVEITAINEHNKLLWGKMKNTYIVLRNSDGTKQVKKV